MSQVCPVTLHNALETADRLEAFALRFYKAGSGEPKPIEWITEPRLVERFVKASGLRNPDPDPPTTALQHDLLLRLQNGEIRTCRIYRSFPDRPGALIFSNGMTRTHPDLHAVILEAYGLSHYSPRLEARRAKISLVDEERDTASNPALIEDVTSCVEANRQRDAGDPWVVVVWSDYPDQHHNEDWAAWFEAQRPDNTFTMEASGLTGLVDVLSLIRREEGPVRQVIMSVHGTEAEFDLRSPEDPFHSQYCCGLYSGQTTPSDFALALRPYLAQESTITLLSCDTAGVRGEHDGRELMRQISEVLTNYDLASDAPVFVTVLGQPTVPYTSGNIYRSTPVHASPVVYRPAGHDQPIPIGYF